MATCDFDEITWCFFKEKIDFEKARDSWFNILELSREMEDLDG